MLATTTSSFAPSAHRIQRSGLGFTRGLTRDELRRACPGAFALDKHESRSDRYTYIPTIDIIDGMEKAGFIPVKAMQANCRTEGKKDHGKHLIRFRREDQMGASEAREVILKNSHDGTSAYEMSAGVFRLVCSNGLVVGREDVMHKLRHSGNQIGNVIDVASRIVDEFDLVNEDIDLMKSVTLDAPMQIAFANAAIAARFDDVEMPITPDQALRARRQADMPNDVFTVFNRLQENLVKGGLMGVKKNELGIKRYARTREVKGIDQNTALNRALWTLGVEVAKLAK